jgi:hypothetical protein
VPDDDEWNADAEDEEDRDVEAPLPARTAHPPEEAPSVTRR